MAFDFGPLFPATLPTPAAKWAGAPRYNFTGGNNDPAAVPLDRPKCPRRNPCSRARAARCRIMASPADRRATGRCANSSRSSSSATPALIARPRIFWSYRARCRRYRSGQRRAAVARRHRHRREGQLPGHADAAHAARRADVVGIPLDEDGMRMDALERARRPQGASVSRNSSTPSRPSRTRPAASCRERRQELLRLAKTTACRSSRTNATPT